MTEQFSLGERWEQPAHPPAYVAWTGATRPAQVETLVEAVEPPAPGERILVVSVLVTRDTVEGRPARVAHSNRYPPMSLVGSILSATGESALGIVSYEPGDVSMIGTELDQVCRVAGHVPDGFQINKAIDLPVGQFARAARRLEARLGFRPRLVLQLYPGLLGPYRTRLIALVRRVEPLVDAGATDLLIDLWSAGEGKAVDLGEAESAIEILGECLPQAGLVLAGGLSAATLAAYEDLFRSHPGLSLDAESRVRDELTDEAAPERVIAFVRAGRQMP